MRGFILGVLVTLVVAFATGYLVLRGGLIPANADTAPGGLEKWAARTSLRATMDRDAPKGPNPVALNDANLSEGVTLYGKNCAICHGTAQGNASASALAKGENPRPPQLGSHGVEDDPEGVSFWKVKHGVRWTGMPAWKASLTDQQIWTVALFLKHMDKLTPGAQQAWEALKN